MNVSSIADLDLMTVTKQSKSLSLADQQQHTIDFLVNLLSAIAEYRDTESDDPVAYYHVTRIKVYTFIMLQNLRDLYPEYNITSDEDIAKIVQASALHDIGKIAVPECILTKPTKLSRDEFRVIKQHTVYGANILDKFIVYEDDFYRYCHDIVMYHHERWDGGGYPEKLSGESIPIVAQVVGIADVYDALVNVKVYRGAYDRKKAEEMIISGACGAFNPKILRCFKESLDDFAKVNEKYT